MYGSTEKRSGWEQAVLQPAQEGMQVYDRDGQPIGAIDQIHIGSTGEDGDTGRNLPSNEAGRVAGGNTGLGEILQDVFEGAGEMDEEIREDLLRAGFIRVRGEGTNSRSQYIKLDRITGIQNNAVHLRDIR